MRVPARLRLWPSSPICTIWPTSALMSTGPTARTAAASAGPSTSRIQVSRSMTSGAYAPYRRTLPSPSLSVHQAVRAVGLVAQHPDPHRRRHDAGHRADAAPVVAGLPGQRGAVGQAAGGQRRRRRVGRVGQALQQHGPDQRAAQRTAGPLPRRPVGRRGRTRRGARPDHGGAGRTSTRDAPAASMRATAASLAATRRGSATTRTRSSSVPGGGGRQSTREVRRGLRAAARRRGRRPRRRRPAVR